MPLPLLHKRRGEGVKDYSDLVLGLTRPGIDTETLLQVFADGKVDRALELGFAEPHVTDAGKCKRAELSSRQIESEQIPEIFDATEVIRLDGALFIGFGAGLLVFEAGFKLLKNGVA